MIASPSASWQCLAICCHQRGRDCRASSVITFSLRQASQSDCFPSWLAAMVCAVPLKSWGKVLLRSNGGRLVKTFARVLFVAASGFITSYSLNLSASRLSLTLPHGDGSGWSIRLIRIRKLIKGFTRCLCLIGFPGWLVSARLIVGADVRGWCGSHSSPCPGLTASGVWGWFFGWCFPSGFNLWPRHPGWLPCRGVVASPGGVLTPSFSPGQWPVAIAGGGFWGAGGECLVTLYAPFRYRWPFPKKVNHPANKFLSEKVGSISDRDACRKLNVL